MIRNAEQVLEYPMVDRDPLPCWTRGRVTLLGRRRAPDVSARLERRRAGDPGCKDAGGLPEAEFDVDRRAEGLRSGPPQGANDLVLMNRGNPPDAILREVWQRSGDKPFARIEDVISERGAGGDVGGLQARRRLRARQPRAPRLAGLK